MYRAIFMTPLTVTGNTEGGIEARFQNRASPDDIVKVTPSRRIIDVVRAGNVHRHIEFRDINRLSRGLVHSDSEVHKYLSTQRDIWRHSGIEPMRTEGGRVHP